MAPQPIENRVLLVKPTHQRVRKAASAGLGVVALVDPEDAGADTDLIEKFSEVLVRADLSSESAVRQSVAEQARRHRVAHVVHPVADELALPVREEAWLLGLASGPPPRFAGWRSAGEDAGGAAGEEARDGPADERLPAWSVQTLSVDGEHRVLGVCARRPAGFAYPAPLDGVGERAVAAAATAVLDSAGLRDGPAHVTLAGDPAALRVVRAAAGMAGHRMPLLLELGTGFDVESATFRALVTGEVDVPRARRCAELGYFEVPAGRLRAVAGIDSICALPYVQAVCFPFVPGDLVPHGTGAGTGSGCGPSGAGYVVVTGDSPAECAERARNAVGLLQADIELTGPPAEPR